MAATIDKGNLMDDLDQNIREFLPIQDDWRSLESLLELAFGSTSPQRYYDAIFNLFERFPDDDGSGVFWSALHGIEHHGNYESKLLKYFRRQPGTMTKAMLLRLRNAGQETIDGFPIDRLLDHGKGKGL
ncbi:MAG: hypothetical protein IPN71_02090 [Fibrobacteres bacterium]|nr:hypothetical protein [Fibrobacterota bacterium]